MAGGKIYPPPPHTTCQTILGGDGGSISLFSLSLSLYYLYTFLFWFFNGLYLYFVLTLFSLTPLPLFWPRYGVCDLGERVLWTREEKVNDDY